MRTSNMPRPLPFPSALPPNVPVFVTGASGLIGSHVTSLLLSYGIPVRASVRSVSESTLITQIFKSLHPNVPFTPIVVPDMKVRGAFDGHFAGCCAVAHVASDLSFSADPNDVITGCVEAVKGVMRAAAAEPGVQRVVYTSSSNAATNPLVRPKRSASETGDADQNQNEGIWRIDSDSWNDTILETAWAPPPYTSERAYAVYAASKVACERAAWNFIRSEKPEFVLNSVLPNYTTGCILQSRSMPGAGSTARWVRDAYERPFEEEYISKIRDQQAQWQVDVEDVARLHLAALLHDDVVGERLLAFGTAFNYEEFLKVFREMAPERLFPVPEDVEGEMWPATVVETSRSVELLKRFGQNGWTSFDESVRRTCLDA